jgi:hypothetical protein
MASALDGNRKAYDLHAFSRDALHAALSNDRCKVTEVAGAKRVAYLADYLESPQGIEARTLVVEHNYTDGDYLDDFAAY